MERGRKAELYPKFPFEPAPNRWVWLKQWPYALKVIEIDKNRNRTVQIKGSPLWQRFLLFTFMFLYGRILVSSWKLKAHFIWCLILCVVYHASLCWMTLLTGTQTSVRHRLSAADVRSEMRISLFTLVCGKSTVQVNPSFLLHNKSSEVTQWGGMKAVYRSLALFEQPLLY